jgi:hypothetical protein
LGRDDIRIAAALDFVKPQATQNDMAEQLGLEHLPLTFSVLATNRERFGNLLESNGDRGYTERGLDFGS